MMLPSVTEAFPGHSSLFHPPGSHRLNVYERCEGSVHTSKSTEKLVFVYKSVCWSGAL